MGIAVVGDVRYLLDGGFFNGMYIGEGEEPTYSYDRMYDSEEMCEPYRNIVTEGIYAPEQVVGSESELVPGFNVSISNGRQAVVYPGSGIIDGHWFRLDIQQAVEIPVNSLLTNRLDSLIIEIDMNDRAVYLVYRTGSSPTNPPKLVDNSSYKEFRLCNIDVTSNTVSNQTASYEDTRGTEECPYITGLLQQLTLDERLDKFDEDVEQKLQSYDTQFDNKLSAYDNTFNSKISGYDATFNNKIQSYDNMMNLIQSEWEQLKQQIIDTGGGGGSTDISIIQQHQSYTSGTITVDGYNSITDTIFVFINGFFANTTTDYDFANGVITFKNTINSGASIDIILFRVITGATPVDGFSLTLFNKDNAEVNPNDSDQYPVVSGLQYDVETPNYSDCTWQWQYRSAAGDSWTDIADSNARRVTITPSSYYSIQCIVTYDGEAKTSKEMIFTASSEGVVATPTFTETYLNGIDIEPGLSSDGLSITLSNWSELTANITNPRLAVIAPIASGEVYSTSGTLTFTVGASESSAGNALVLAQNTAYNTSSIKLRIYVYDADNTEDRTNEAVIYVLTDTARAYDKVPAPTLSASRSGSIITISISGTIPNASYYYGTSATQSSQTTAITNSATMSSNSALTFYAHGEANNIENSDNSNGASVASYNPGVTSWTQAVQSVASDSNGANIVFQNGKFFICLLEAPYLIYSTDGINWNSCSVPSDVTSVNYVFSYNSYYYAAAGHSSYTEAHGIVLKSIDGINWTSAYTENNVRFDLIGGLSDTDVVLATGSPTRNKYTTNGGSNWTQYTDNVRPNTFMFYDRHGMLFGGYYYSSGGVTRELQYSTNVASWSDMQQPSDIDRVIDMVYVSGARMLLYENTSDTYRIAIYTDLLSSPTSIIDCPGTAVSICSSDNVVTIVCQDSTSNLYSYSATWDGSQLSSWMSGVSGISRGASNGGKWIAYGNGRAVFLGYDTRHIYYSNTF